jgi:membrane protease YdiL (CAAX protease family)
MAVFSTVAIGGMSLVSGGMALAGIDISDPAAGLVVLLAMWTPFLGAVVAARWADGGWRSPFRLRRWGRPGWMVLGLPLLLPLLVYGITYALAFGLDAVEWNPAGGKWDSPGRVAVNVLARLGFGLVFGSLSALGEEIGWRGYLQPRLDELGVRGSLWIVMGLEVLWHIPIILGAGYLIDGSVALTLALFALLKLVLTPIWTWGTYYTTSIWTAVFFHSCHNSLSQSIYPPLFDSSVQDLWTGELGIVPIALYGVVAVTGFVMMKRRGGTPAALASQAISKTREALAVEGSAKSSSEE